MSWKYLCKDWINILTSSTPITEHSCSLSLARGWMYERGLESVIKLSAFRYNWGNYIDSIQNNPCCSIQSDDARLIVVYCNLVECRDTSGDFPRMRRILPLPASWKYLFPQNYVDECPVDLQETLVITAKLSNSIIDLDAWRVPWSFPSAMWWWE